MDSNWAHSDSLPSTTDGSFPGWRLLRTRVMISDDERIGDDAPVDIVLDIKESLAREDSGVDRADAPVV